MKKSTEIETELDSVTKRLNELNRMRGEINNNLETLQSGFVDGKQTLDDLQAEQGKLAALDSSIKVLEAKQEELHNAFQKADLSESVTADIGRLKTIAEQAGETFSEWDDLRVKLGETIAAAVEEIVSKSAAFYGKQREFRAVRNSIEAKQSGIDINAELSRLGVSNQAYTSAVTEYVHLSPCKFGECVALAERFAAFEMLRRQQAATVSV